MPTNPFRVALTFDTEHPDQPRCRPGVQDEILDILAKEHVQATFFVQGRWATAYPDTLRRIAAGHVIGNHSHHHADMTLLTDGGIKADVSIARDKIKELCGVDPWPLFRLPFGAGLWDSRVIASLAQMEYRNVYWDVEAWDWHSEADANTVEKTIAEETLKRGDGAIVLLHIWPEPTVVALPGIIRRLREAGAEFVTAEKLLPQ
jgi:peptidoglycan-N-acetylglucosamine deacetylase